MTTTTTAPAVRDLTFPEAGDGVALRLRFSDLKVLRDTFGADYFGSAASRCDQLDTDFIAKVLEVGGRQNGQRKPIDLASLEDLPLATIAGKALDALYLVTFGRTFEDELRHRAARAAEAIATATDAEAAPA